MFQYAAPHANLIGGAHPNYAPPPARVAGAMVPYHDIVGSRGYRAYDIVGQATADQTTWQKITSWGNTPTMGVKRKWLVLGAVVVATTWYGYYAKWSIFR